MSVLLLIQKVQCFVRLVCALEGQTEVQFLSDASRLIEFTVFVTQNEYCKVLVK